MSGRPELSIVIAVSGGPATVGRCLEAIVPQTDGRNAEILVACNRADTAGPDLRAAFPQVMVIESDRPRLIPELWGLAAAHATGRLLAVTVSACVPDPRWVAAILAAHEGDAAAVGGAIEQDPGADLVNWGVYFVRYTPYMLPFAPAEVREVPGDNGTYRYDAIAEWIDEIGRRGFWESEINARLRRRGLRLVRDPAIVVVHTRSFDFAGFSRQRFRHGVLFGRARARGQGPAPRLVRAAATPVLLPLMVVRIVRELTRRRRHLPRFVLALPLVCWFLACWLAGEAAGLVLGPDVRPETAGGGP